MRDNHLPLEQRIGSVRGGDTTDHGTPIGSTPLAVQPPRRPAVHDIKQECARNVTETDGNITAVGYIVDRLTTLFWAMKDAGRPQDKNTIADAIAEIERLQCQVRSQAMELLIAHSEALGLYDITMVCHTPDETDVIRQQHDDYVEENPHG